MPPRDSFTFTPRMETSASGWQAPRTSQGAALEMSPGTRKESGSRRVAGWMRTLAGPSASSAPIDRSIRSLWSRDFAGSATRVSPSA